PHLRLVGVLVHLERVLVLLDQLVALLRDDGAEQDLAWMEAHDALPCTAGSAASLTSSERAHTTSVTSSSDGTVTTTRSRLRNDLMSASSSSPTTTTVGKGWLQRPSTSAALRVEGPSNALPEISPSVPAPA